MAAAANARAMSGTKLRAAAVANDFQSFAANVVIGSYTKEEAKGLMNMIRIALGYPEAAGGGRLRAAVRRRTKIVKKHKGRKTMRK